MSTNRKRLGVLLCLVVLGIAVASTAGAASKSAHASKTITIGGTFPLNEPNPPNGASLYKTITAAEQAYFGYVNSNGGVDGRQIHDIVLNDHYNPSETVAADKTLVESDHVAAIVGSLGTAPGLATMNYLNSKKIPQVLLATGDAYWGLCALTGMKFKKQPGVCTKPRTWTMGWQPDYPGESKLYAKYILNHPASGGPKIGVLYQDDPYGQNYLAGLAKGLGSHWSDIIGYDRKKNRAPDGAYAVGESSSQIIARVGKLEADGANTFVIFATPTATISALVGESAVLHWSPPGGTFLNNVSANRIFLLKAESLGADPSGVISTTYIKSQSVTPNDPAMQLGKGIIYAAAAASGNPQLKAQWDAGDNNLVYGLAVAWTFVDALHHAPKFTDDANTTKNRLLFMKAIRSLNEKGKNANPFVYPGMVVKTSAAGTFPMEQLQFERWSGVTHDWKTFGGVTKSGH